MVGSRAGVTDGTTLRMLSAEACGTGGTGMSEPCLLRRQPTAPDLVAQSYGRGPPRYVQTARSAARLQPATLPQPAGRTYLTLTVNLLVMAFSLPLRKAFATSLHLPSLPNVTRSLLRNVTALGRLGVPADRVLLLGPVGRSSRLLFVIRFGIDPLIFCGTTAAGHGGVGSHAG